MSRLVFLLEEPSMKNCLEGLLPRVIPNTDFFLVPHEGKQDLERSIPTKMRGWKIPGDQFIIVRDQDNGDCLAIKNTLRSLCTEAGREPLLIRIACRELESWFLGDLMAVESGTGAKNLAKKQKTQKYRNPDSILKPSREMQALVNGYLKRQGAKAIGPHLRTDGGNTSHSFNVFVSGVQRAASQL